MISSFNKKALKHSYLGILMLAILGCLLLTNGKSNAVQQSSSTKLQKAIPLSSYKKSNLEAFANKSKLNSVLYSHASKDGKISITIDEVKGKNFKGKVMLVSDPQKIAVGYSLKNNKVNKTTSEIAKMNNSLAAINGGAYFYDSSPVGFIISNGNLAFYKPDISVRRSKIATVGFNDKGKLIVGSYSLNQIQKLGIKEGTSSLLTLISNGVVNKIISTQGWGIAPRTAIGQKKDGTVVFLTIDGRSLASIGATIKEVTAILKQFDVINGALLDGGSSTTMYYNGKVISHPCDISHFKPYIRHAECKVPSIFFVKP